MGNAVSKAATAQFRFKDNMRSIECDKSDTCAVCIRDHRATVYCQSTFSSKDLTRTSFTVVQLPHGAVVSFGVLDEDPDGHADDYLGSPAMKNSVGYLSNGDIIIDGKTLDRCRAYTTGDVITVEIKKGKVTFGLNGKPVSEKIRRLNLAGRFRFGSSISMRGSAVLIGTVVTMDKRAFVKEVLEDATSRLCFEDNIRSVDCCDNDTVAVCVADFKATVHFTGTFTSDDELRCSFRVLAAPAGGTMCIGILDGGAEGHSENFIGSHMKNSMGLISTGAVVTSAQVFEECRPYGAGDVVTVEAAGGRLNFLVNGQVAAPAVLNNLSIKGVFRLGVSFSTKGQAVCIGADAPSYAAAFIAQRLSSSDADAVLPRGGGGEIPGSPRAGQTAASPTAATPAAVPASPTAPAAPAAPPAAKAPAGPSTTLRFSDALKTVKFDAVDLCAVCVRDGECTAYMTTVVEPGQSTQLNVRVLAAPSGGMLVVGVMSENTAGAESGVVGLLPSSLGLTMDGAVLKQEAVFDRCSGFGAGDLITVEITGGRIAMAVNGRLVSPKLQTLGVMDPMRFAVSMSKRGQAVRLGKEPVGDEDRAFVKAKLNEVGGRPQFAGGVAEVDCNEAAVIAVCTEPTTSTMVMENVFDASMSAEATFRLLHQPAATPVRFGLCDPDCIERGTTVLGDVVLEKSWGLESGGKLITDGTLVENIGRSITPGDAVTVKVDKGVLHFFVNGEEVGQDGTEGRTLEGRYCFGISLSEMGQAVSIGTDLPSGGEAFLKKYGIQAPPDGPAAAAAKHVDPAAPADVEGLLDIATHGALFPDDYVPPAPLAEALQAGATALSAVGELDFVLEECARMATERQARTHISMEADEALALVLYSYDLGAMSEHDDGSDNFYFVVNTAMRSRDPALILALRPFLFHFTRAFLKVPRIAQRVYYRGVPATYAGVIRENYTLGRQVSWGGITSLSAKREVSAGFAKRLGAGGVLMEISVVDARNISSFSSIPSEDEVLLAPNCRLVVIAAIAASADDDGVFVLKLQQLDSSAQLNS